MTVQLADLERFQQGTRNFMNSYNIKRGKALISTFTYGNNYGQRLQNLALQTIFEELGFETWTFQQPSNAYWAKKIKKIIKHPQDIISEIQRTKTFDKFNESYINLYHANSKMKDLYDKKLKDEFDLFITGSDQVWNPYSSDVNESHFLTFVPPEKKIAFAPSFSVENIPREKQDLFKTVLNNFLPNRISIRESRGAEIIKELSGIDASVILDPTLIFDDDFWIKYASEPQCEIHSDYILVYVLGEFNIQELKYSFPGKKIVDLMHDKHLYSTVGPQEFLWIIKNATMVFTDSYHCMVFSLLFDKKFKIINRGNERFSMKSRITTICEKFHIPEEKILFESDTDYKVPHDDFMYHLIQERNKTMNFLSDALI